MTKNLVAYFSASGVTGGVAKNLAHVIDADLYEIKPKTPYTEADLNWMDKNSRTTIEMKDKTSRPEIIENDAKIEDYDTVFLGFPIWWYVAPTIINTFLEKYDFSNKKIVLFATSGGSGLGETAKYLRPSLDSSCEIIEGGILKASSSIDKMKDWVNNLNIEL